MLRARSLWSFRKVAARLSALLRALKPVQNALLTLPGAASAWETVLFGVLAVSQLHAVRWTGYVALIAVLIAIAQMIVEGPRWQMVPAYVLTGLFFLVWLLQSTALAGRPANRLAAGLAIGLGTLALVISAALPIVSPVFRFPRPSGPYAIGTLTYHWVDAARPEVFTAEPNDHRELIVQVWYPAQPNRSAPRAPYVRDAGALAPGLARLAQQNAERLLPGFSLTVPSFPFTHLKYITTNAIPSAPAAQDESSYPVLIFLEGLNGLRQMNTFEVEELVSHGYIVAASISRMPPPKWSFQMDARSVDSRKIS